MRMTIATIAEEGSLAATTGMEAAAVETAVAVDWIRFSEEGTTIVEEQEEEEEAVADSLIRMVDLAGTKEEARICLVEEEVVVIFRMCLETVVVVVVVEEEASLTRAAVPALAVILVVAATSLTSEAEAGRQRIFYSRPIVHCIVLLLRHIIVSHVLIFSSSFFLRNKVCPQRAFLFVFLVQIGLIHTPCQ